jgi:hypothetical protein
MKSFQRMRLLRPFPSDKSALLVLVALSIPCFAEIVLVISLWVIPQLGFEESLTTTLSSCFLPVGCVPCSG